MSKYLLLLLFALSYVTAFAQADTKDADEAYANAEYAKAISLYQEAITNAPEPTSELYYNLGCASQRNLAAMVANPSDLVQPRPETPAYTGRRTFALDKYRQGQATATTYPDADKNKISSVGQ